MNRIVYPDKHLLEWWIKYLEENSENEFLIQYLPKTDNEWVDRVMGVLSLIQMNEERGYVPPELHHIAARIFYKINKSHNEIDGNKRSSIIVIYLFYLLNDFILLKSMDIGVMAKKIAKSKGRGNQESWFKKIQKFFIERTVAGK